MHAFIDTNILLSFYHLSNDDLEELKKLAVLIQQKSVTLYLTDQIAAEFARNREVKIADAVKRLKDQRLNLQFPQICKDFTEYDQLRNLQQLYDKTHAQLLNKLQDAIQKKALKADAAIAALFESTETLTTSDNIVTAARLRMEVGNPPGKNGSLGDALNWELLLQSVPKNQDIYFITEDKDYVSALDETKFKDFLLDEWSKKKAGDVFFYKRLSSFFKDKFPQIKLASELEKDILIQNLANSANFAATHSLIAKLNKYTEFTTSQAEAILSTTTTNNQIGWIATDSDVKAFVLSILKNHQPLLDPKLVDEIKNLTTDPSEDAPSLDEPPS
jgi:predicted nucleic acid-binding protein